MRVQPPDAGGQVALLVVDRDRRRRGLGCSRGDTSASPGWRGRSRPRSASRLGQVVERRAADRDLAVKLAATQAEICGARRCRPAAGPPPRHCRADEVVDLSRRRRTAGTGRASGTGSLPLNPPMAMTGRPVASWQPAAFCDPMAAATQRVVGRSRAAPRRPRRSGSRRRAGRPSPPPADRRPGPATRRLATGAAARSLPGRAAGRAGHRRRRVPPGIPPGPPPPVTAARP